MLMKQHAVNVYNGTSRVAKYFAPNLVVATVNNKYVVSELARGNRIKWSEW